MSTQQYRERFIDGVRRAATDLLVAIGNLDNLEDAWNREVSLSLVDASGDDPGEEGYDSGDFEYAQGLTKADIAAVFTTLAAVNSLLVAGHGTNLQKVRK